MLNPFEGIIPIEMCQLIAHGQFLTIELNDFYAKNPKKHLRIDLLTSK